MNSTWIELRAHGKMFGRVSLDGTMLEFKERDLLVRFDLSATVRERHPQVVRVATTLLLTDEQERCDPAA